MKKSGILFLLLIIVAGACRNNPASVKDTVRESRSLNGTWEIIFDHENEGREKNWQKEGVFRSLENKKEIAVPGCWEEIEKDYEGVAFYGRHIDVPEDWKDEVVFLKFDAVNYIAEVWVNDYAAGAHEGGYGPFELRVDDLLNYGEKNFISLRVIGPIVVQDKVIDGIGKNDMPHWRGAITGGIWQSVSLETRGKAYVHDAFIIPKLEDNTASLDLLLRNESQTTGEFRVHVSIFPVNEPENLVAAESRVLSIDPGTDKSNWSLRIPSARYWSPKDPYLYSALIQVSDETGIIDQIETRFGMRELTVRDNKFYLNGELVFIKAAFFEGLYPHSLALPESEEMARKEIQLAKDCGFNIIRPWRKPPPPGWLDLCDEMGMMVIGSMPLQCMNNWPTVTPYLSERIENEVRSAIMRDRNRACIIQWEIFNELYRKELHRMKFDMSMLARELDPSRLINDESGGFAGGSNLYLPYQKVPLAFNDVHAYPGAPFNTFNYDKFQTISRTDEEIEEMGLPRGRFTSSNIKSGKLSIVSEIGYGSLPDLVDNNKRFAAEGNPRVPPYRYHHDLAEWYMEVLKESGLDEVYPDLQEFCLDQQKLHSQANKRMIEAIRSNPLINGYVVHALTGGDWVTGAGLLDLFRNPKESYKGTKEAIQARYLAVQVRPRNVYAEQGANIIIKGINDLEYTDGTLQVKIKDADGKIVDEIQDEVELATGVTELINDKLNTGSYSGEYTVHVTLTNQQNELISRNTLDFTVYTGDQLEMPETGIVLFDGNSKLAEFLSQKGIPYEEFGKGTPLNKTVFVSGAMAADAHTEDRFESLDQFAKKGGTVVHLGLLEPGDHDLFWHAERPSKKVLPLDFRFQVGRGLWICVSHIVTDHPVFKGLPRECMMGQDYENVWAAQSIRGIEGELIVGAISHGFYQDNLDAENYLGPEPAWYGMELGVVPRGKGRYILSALRIIPNLGQDPVADKILYNLIDWTSD